MYFGEAGFYFLCGTNCFLVNGFSRPQSSGTLSMIRINPTTGGQTVDEGTGMTMAQPSSVQREPSMEEILASIRRIIEDNETSRKDEKPAAQTEAVKVSEATVTSPRKMEAPVAKAPEIAPAVAAEAAQPAQAAPKPVDIAAEMVSIRPAYKPEVVAMERPAPAPVEVDAEAEAELEETGELDVVLEEDEIEPVAEAEPVAVAETVEASESPAPIVSEHSERKIAMAFSELNEAYQAVRRKSLAEAAEDMLRPMLREWIDDNLPQLVEKLVREEIERIARGS